MNNRRKPPQGNVRRGVSRGMSQPKVMANKLGRTIQCETQSRHALALRLDRDPAVYDYISLPEVVEYMDPGGKRRSFIPEFKVFRDNGGIELHIVHSPGTGLAERLTRAEALLAICQARGWGVVAHSERTLPGPTEYANLLALICFRPTAYMQPSVAEAVAELLAGGVRLKLRALVAAAQRNVDLPGPVVTCALGHLLWHAALHTDLNQLLFAFGTPTAEAKAWLPDVEVLG